MKTAAEILAKHVGYKPEEIELFLNTQFINPKIALKAMEEYRNQGIPTDEEINQEAIKRWDLTSKYDFIDGAKWIKQQIHKDK
jgi:hypothetical protein